MSIYGTYLDLSRLTTIEEENGIFLEEEEEENDHLMALLTAADEGNITALEDLLASHPDIDINTRNKYGETAMHLAVGSGHFEAVQFLNARGFSLVAGDKNNDEPIFFAARQGNFEILKYLKEQQGVSLDRQNRPGESCIHVAVRYGHIDIIKYICEAGANINLQDKQGDSPLHLAAWYDLPSEVTKVLCSSGGKVNTRNKEDDTPLHCAAARGNLDCLRILLEHGALIDILDKWGSTALHLSCRRRHISIAIVLLQAGCQFDIVDQNGETALHPACREGLLPVVQTMCAYGCKVDIVSKTGMAPIHLASKHGHTEVVRCLLLSGALVDLPNKDGITPEVMAIAQGQNEAADLLGRLRPDRQEACILQLMPNQTPLNRIKVKVFGSSGVGKTTLIDSLKCGYFGSLLRKAGIGNIVQNSTTSSISGSKGIIQENGLQHHRSLDTQLSFEAVHDGYTHGIDVQQATVSGAGDISFWEFSGYEPYYMMYDHFIGDPNCIHMVVFSLVDSQDVHLAQLLFWLNFLKARMLPMEPIGHAGRLPRPARVLLVATHLDKSSLTANGRGEYESPEVSVILETVRQKFEAELNIYPKAFIVDSHLAMSSEMKVLKTAISDIKASICQNLPVGSGFLDATVAALPAWRRSLASYPVVTWPSFTEYIRTVVNILAGEEHMKELMCQLQLIGEVVYVETERPDDDLVVLSPRWLCGSIIGQALSHNGTLRPKQTGCFSIEDFQMRFPDCEADDLLVLLEALQVSTCCDIEGEVEYELPCLNFVETLNGLWDRVDNRLPEDCIYGGVRLVAQRGMTNQLMHIFPRIQVQLRRQFLEEQSDPEVDLYQWYHGSKYCRGNLEILLTLEQEEQVIEIKCRGPSDLGKLLYHFQEDICDVVFGVIEDSLPSVSLERHLLSAYQLAAHHSPVAAYIPKDVLLAEMDGRETLTFNCGGKVVKEQLIDLVAFGSKEIYAHLKPGLELHVSHLSLNARRHLSAVLDPPDPIGRDWCLLAVSVGLANELPHVDTQDSKSGSKTDHILALWMKDPNATIRLLVQKLLELGRSDAVDAVLSSAPMFRHFPPEGKFSDGTRGLTNSFQSNANNSRSS